MNFTPQLLINNSSEFRWVYANGFLLAASTGFSFFPLIMGQKLALSKENVLLALEWSIQTHGFCRKYKKGVYCYE
jgi:hypothetical protein